MFSAAEICKEIEELASLLACRGGPTSERLRASSVGSIAAQIARLPTCNTAAALQLQQAITSCSLPASVRTELEDAVDARLANHHVVDKKSKVVGKVLLHVLSYLIAGDWARMRDPRCTESQMRGVIYERLVKLGVDALDEQTVKVCIMTLLHLMFTSNGTWPSYQAIYDKVQEFKRCSLFWFGA